jgi:hypothetical protein
VALYSQKKQTLRAGQALDACHTILENASEM